MSKNTFATVIPPLSAFGEWRTAGEDIWNEATVAPWRGLFENLDDLATDLPESETPLSLADEALAIFAACWRYGSYAHVLTHGAPLPEAIRRDPEAGRITDWEMRRIQIEFTAALADWWELEDTEPEKACSRARVAREFLPMPECRMLSDEATMQHLTSKVRQLHENIEDPQEAEKVLAKQWPLRQEANSTVVQTYRNGPIESLHANTAAPWNLRGLAPVPRFAGVGRVLIGAAVQVSQSLGWSGKTGLHSLPQAESFYRRTCGMQDLGRDDNYDKLRYFELSAADADTFMRGGLR